MLRFLCIIFFIILSFSTPAFGQKPCELTYDKLPAMRGFRLGMSVSDILKNHAPTRSSNQDAYGRQTISLSPSNLLESERGNLRLVTLEFLDSKLFSISIDYSNEIKFETLQEFADAVSDKLKFPPFEISQSTANLQCKNFNITLYFENSYYKYTLSLLVEDPSVKKEIEIRKGKSENVMREERKKAFKP